MLLLNGSELFHQLRRDVEKAPQVKLAIAYWGTGSVDALGLHGTDQKITIVCNLSQGCTNPAEIRKLLARGATVYSSDILHAKAGVIEDLETAFLGSSNASSNGWNFERAGNAELNVLDDDVRFMRHKSRTSSIFTLGTTAAPSARVARSSIVQSSLGRLSAALETPSPTHLVQKNPTLDLRSSFRGRRTAWTGVPIW